MVKTNYANVYKEVLIILDNLIKEDVDSTEVTEADLDKIYAHTRMSDYSCPRVKVEPIDIRKQSGIRTTQKTNRLGR